MTHHTDNSRFQDITVISKQQSISFTTIDNFQEYTKYPQNKLWNPKPGCLKQHPCALSRNPVQTDLLSLITCHGLSGMQILYNHLGLVKRRARLEFETKENVHCPSRRGANQINLHVSVIMYPREVSLTWPLRFIVSSRRFYYVTKSFSDLYIV